MYQSLLIRKYLTSKVMPLFSVIAVTLCTGTVMVVWSIMGGFLNMLLDSGRTLTGDVSITWPTVGFGGYAELERRLAAESDVVEATTPIIETYAMLGLPDGRNEFVQVRGIDGPSYAKVVDYDKALYWRPLETPMPRDKGREDPRLQPEQRERFARALADGRALEAFDPETKTRSPALVLGSEVSNFNRRHDNGFYTLGGQIGVRLPEGVRWISGHILDHKVTLSVLPIDKGGGTLTFTSFRFPIANETRTGVFDADKRTISAPLPQLQRMLKMDEAISDPSQANPYQFSKDPGTGRESFGDSAAAPRVVEPARVTSVLVRAKPGVSPDVLKERCRAVYSTFFSDTGGKGPSPSLIKINTWREQQGMFIAAVEKEIVMVLFILGIVSLTVVFLILSIFWSMVNEKTKDIGILRSMGASRLGVAALWVGYGLAIGVCGAVLGGIGSTLIVRNINSIHDWLGRQFDITIWDPKVYYFLEIPHHIDPMKLVIVLTGGVLASVAGAFIPALRAARMDPVRALRFE